LSNYSRTSLGSKTYYMTYSRLEVSACQHKKRMFFYPVTTIVRDLLKTHSMFCIIIRQNQRQPWDQASSYWKLQCYAF